MMKYILIFLFCFPAVAKMKRFLVPCSDGSGVCNIGSTQSPGNIICQVPDDQDGDLYDVRIVEIPDGFIGQILDLIGLGNDRPWAPGEVVADNEQIVCTIDPVKVQAKADARAAAEAAEKAKRDKRKSDWDTLCAAPKAGLETILCEERGY